MDNAGQSGAGLGWGVTAATAALRKSLSIDSKRHILNFGDPISREKLVINST